MLKLKEDINWEVIIESVKSGSCMLFLGPEAVALPDGMPIYHAALEHIKNKYSKDITFYTGEEFLHPHRSSLNGSINMGISSFYNQQQIPTIFEAIAEIPFYFILNASPDNYLKQVFDQKKNFKFHAAYYEVEAVQKEINDISKERPLLYNIFGMVEKPSSLIFTHDNLFKFLFSIIGKDNFKMHQTVTSQFQNATFLVFLGFKFEKWYIKLLLRLLGIHESEIEKNAMGFVQHSDDSETKNFFYQHFNVEFVESHIQEFVTELHKRCAESNLLRDFTKTHQNPHKEKFFDMIDELDIAQFFQQIELLSLSSEEKIKLNIFRQEFIGGQAKNDIYYHSRLKTFVQELSFPANSR